MNAFIERIGAERMAEFANLVPTDPEQLKTWRQTITIGRSIEFGILVAAARHAMTCKKERNECQDCRDVFWIYCLVTGMALDRPSGDVEETDLAKSTTATDKGAGQ